MADRVTIELQPRGESLSVERGTPLRLVLHEHGVEFPCGGHAACAGCRVRITGGAPPAEGEHAAVLTREELADGWRLACRCTAERDLVLHVEQWETVILADQSPFAFQPRDGLGIAVDVGTTTLVAQLVDLRRGGVLAVRSALNPGAAAGADVMSRVHAARDEGTRRRLVAELRRSVGGLVTGLADAAPAGMRVESIVAAGNTVMHHLFGGIDLRPLSAAPFEPARNDACRLGAGELGWRIAGDPEVRFLPCLGGFVGSDILCGILATRIGERETPSVLIDLGTNGEIAVGNRERILCASTAAGPAFEGGGIGMGMRASTGAVSEVALEDGRLRCRVIGNTAPRGLCGSGLIDAVACALDAGSIEPSGRLAGGAKALEVLAPVRLSQQDIRQLQLAKAAVAAGLHILRRRFGLEDGDEAPVYLAGAFGNYVNRASARRIGLVHAPEAHLHGAGNTSLLGAKMALFADRDDDFQALRARIEHVPLASDPAFQERFVRETTFPAALPCRPADPPL